MPSGRLQIHKVTSTFYLKICVSANSVKMGPSWQLGGAAAPADPPVAPALLLVLRVLG